MTRTAKCACGATSISVNGEPSIYGICHCDNCKRRTGSAFGISSYFKKIDVVSQEGATHVYAFHHTAQGNNQARHFCPNCGTTLFWYNSGLPQDIGIAAGCFVKELSGEPKLSVTHAKRYPWVALPESWRTVAE
jgi:hypothetical protein